ncbi:MAG: glycine C-acetyltransferase [Firmicutes bacterium]|nr:glycine C-acetyltransferase [Bacillota bacterium]
MSKLDFIESELASLKEQGLLINIRTISSPQGPWFVADQKRVLNLCSNNYLGLANDDRLKAAARQALEKYGVGPGAVRTIAGTMTLHLEIERALADFKGAEDTIFLQSGFVANQAVIPALVGPDDVIFSDELNHASIIDGCRLSGAKIVRYAHNDAGSLEEAARAHVGRRRLVVTDGVFSMDGDIAPLPDIVEVAQRHDLITVVDDAHGEGVLGRGGRGIVDHFGLHGRFDVEIGTLSKAFGVVGGYAAGSASLVRWFKQRARPFLFSTGLSPADVAASIAAVRVLQASDELVKRLWDNASYFKAEMRRLGFDTGVSQTPITPVIIGDAVKASELSKRLFSEGVFAQSIGYPTVPRGKARIRVMISAAHSREDLDYGLEKFAKVGRELGVI